nr:hypothetical protein [uncultured bacterium]
MRSIIESVKQVHARAQQIIDDDTMSQQEKDQQLVMLDTIDDIATRYIAHEHNVSYGSAHQTLMKEIS